MARCLLEDHVATLRTLLPRLQALPREELDVHVESGGTSMSLAVSLCGAAVTVIYRVLFNAGNLDQPPDVLYVPAHSHPASLRQVGVPPPLAHPRAASLPPALRALPRMGAARHLISVCPGA